MAVDVSTYKRSRQPGRPTSMPGAPADAVTERLTEQHLASFPAAQRPMISAPAAVDEDAVRAREVQALVGEVPRFRRAERAVAREKALRNAEFQIGRLRLARVDALVQAQQQSDRVWEGLLGHQADAVRACVETALEQNVHAGAVTDVWTRDGRNGADLVVEVGGLEVLPAEPAGPAHAERDAHVWYLRMVGSTVLATVAGALAASPATDVVTVLVVRPSSSGAPGDGVEPVYAASFDRSVLDLSRDVLQDPAAVICDRPGSLFRLAGPLHEVVPIDLDDRSLLRARQYAARRSGS